MLPILCALFYLGPLSLLYARKKGAFVQLPLASHSVTWLPRLGVFAWFFQSIVSALAPLQLGCGVPSGCEAAARAARQYLKSMPSNHVLLKVDFRNAFNSVRRDKILEAVKSSIPELFLFISSAYSVPSYLVCGDSIILSEESVQQGDPLGPLLFCLTLHPLLSQLQSELKISTLMMAQLVGRLNLCYMIYIIWNQGWLS